MPCGRSYGYRRSYRGRRRGYRRNYRTYNTGRGAVTKFDWKKIAWQAAKGALAYSMTNAELKHSDTSQTPASASGTGSVTDFLVNITQGDTNNTRDGNTIRLKSLLFSITPAIHASATATRIKWSIVLDRRVIPGTTPSYTDIYSGTGINNFKNIDNQHFRFKVLRSGMIYLNSTDRTEAYRKIYLKMSKKICYNDSAQVIMNNIYFVVISDEAVNTPTITMATRARYYDN